MRYRIEHETVLDYPETIREHHIELRLAPRSSEHQRVLSWSIETEPAAELAHYTDYFSNRVDYFCVIPPHKRLVTRLSAVVETTLQNPFAFTPIAAADQYRWIQDAIRLTPALHDLLLYASPMTPDVVSLCGALPRGMLSCPTDRPLLSSLLDLMSWIPTVLEYRAGATTVHAELAAALRQGAGVCQDFAHLFITFARSWGVPTRYVMGYLDSGITAANRKMETHAWAEALVPGGGWIGFDATNGLLANDRYVSVAVGRDSHDAAPQRGSFKGNSSGHLPAVKVTMLQQ